MKIGIITFHWATNYGAVLQAYALQEYLKYQGHQVDIINYKPGNYSFSIKYYISCPRAIKNIPCILRNFKKEYGLQRFRRSYLNLTKRYYSENELDQITDYDCVISGSDQILNPYFTLCGERKPTGSYFLNFAKNINQKIGYAVSFGCETYPQPAFDYAKKWVQNFDRIGVREASGLNVLSDFGFNKTSEVVPDPTILLGVEMFQGIDITDYSCSGDYVCVYMLRYALDEEISNSIVINDTQSYSMENWLGIIKHSKMLITNSYHGMIMALLLHVPFAVLLEQKGNGMNDRFNTLLSKLGLLYRVVDNNLRDLMKNKDIPWMEVDEKLVEYRKTGECFLNLSIEDHRDRLNNH